jgi:polysaccharide export outer membrane protein
MLDAMTAKIGFPALWRSAAALLTALVLFCSTAAALRAEVTGDYKIRVGDIVSVTVYNEATLTQPALRVLPGGTVGLPLAGEVKIAGLTTGGASRAVEKALARYLRQPSVTVAVAQVGPVDVLVLGNVRTPGKYTLQPESRLTDALAAAGGLGPTDGDLPNARMQTYGGAVKEISLQKLLHEGDVSLNAQVENEETIYVPSPLILNVQVLGAVDHAGDVQLHEGDRVLTALARAGTSPSLNPDLNRVIVRRAGSDGKTTTQTVNVYEIVKSADVSKDVVLQKGDVVFVPTAVRHFNLGDMLSTILGIGRYFPGVP